MLNLFKRLFYPTPRLGDNDDTRTSSQIENAYDNREIATASLLQWLPKTTWKSFPVKRQYYTGECVAQSTSKHLGINDVRTFGKYSDLSAEFIYYWRTNKPSQGMIWLDAMKIATTKGSCLNSRITQRVRESEPEPSLTAEMINEGQIYRGTAFIEDKVRSIDSVAQIIEQQGSCLLWFWFDVNGYEWWVKEPKILYPNLGTYDAGATRHALVATDYGVRNGKKVLKIEDSAGNWSAENDQDRFIDAEFMQRCFVAGYVIDLPEAPITPPKPQWTGKRTLQVGMSGDDVKTLQDILKIEGVFTFPNSTGYFGGLTRAGVIRLQEKHKAEILTPLGLSKGTGVVANATIKWLSANYK